MEGIWPLGLLKSTYSAEISGLVLAEGVTDWASMTGRLTPLPLGFELAVEFSDSQGDRYIIDYSYRIVSIFQPSAKGMLYKGAIKIGEVDLYVNKELILKARPSFA